MKRIISLLMVLILTVSFLGVCSINALAAGSSTLLFSKKEVEVGENVTVTVNIKADEKMYAVQFVLKYDPEILDFIGGDDCSGGAGVISVAAGNTSEAASKKYNFKAIKAGSCNISTADMRYVNISDDEISVPNQGDTLTVMDKRLSGNANLKALSLSSGTLSPTFSEGKTSYSVTVDNKVTSCKIYATAADADANVKVEGGSSLKVGSNSCSVTVTAPNGNQKVYKITVTRKEAVASQATSSKEETSSEDTSSKDEKKALQTQVDGVDYFVSKDLSKVTLPTGYTEQKVEFNGVEVTVAVDESKNYTLYYLGTEDSEELAPYTYSLETNLFTKLLYMNQGEKFYIFEDLPQGLTVPDGYYTTNTQISGFNLTCYSNAAAELSSFYYVYCYNGKEYGFYRYDSVENVLQRYPELTMVGTDLPLYEEEEEKEEGLISKFKSLTTNAKIVVIGIFLLILCVLVLAILFTIKLFGRRDEAEFVSNLDYTEDFDDIEYSAAFSLEHSHAFITEDNEENELPLQESELQSPDEIDSNYITEESEDK